jgi:2-oxoglutarate dehydrogenase E2 component (dihydrolipoamide succinyltransferase)
MNIVVPELGESVLEARVARWLKKEGDRVAVGEPLVELETEKIDVEVNAERGGVIASITRQEGQDVRIGEVLGTLDESAAAAPPTASASPAPPATAAAPPAPAPSSPPPAPSNPVVSRRAPGERPGERLEERQRMTKRRETIARRLVEAQHNAAMLTTFNEIDMTAVMGLRERHREAFKQQFGVGLGVVSFFVKVAVAALRGFPQLNAEIQGDEIVLKRYYDIGIAVGAEGGLVVPVLRDADQMSFANIEQAIRDFAKRAGDGTLTLQDLAGGTFTITNGGVFGSLLSTPILNPPQVGILGLHKIQDRPIGVDGQVVLRPMMYVALSYDHRLVDGREAVQFLVKIKDLIEDPAQLLLGS